MIDGPTEVERILNKRLSKCVQQKAHYPYAKQEEPIDLYTRLPYRLAPMPANCRWCGIGGAFRIYYDYGQITRAEVVNGMG